MGWPITPGFETSGVVIATGKKVSHLRVGDNVVGITLFGGYTTHIKLPEHQAYKLPEGFDMSLAAAFPSTYMTAYHALYQQFVVRDNMKFLIHSAAGGVGGALVQLSKILNCSTVGIIGRPDKAEYLKSIGCDHVLCKSEIDWAEEARKISPDGYSAVFDANGASTLRNSFDLLGSTGKLVSYGFHSMLPKKGGRLNYFQLIKTYLQTPKFSPLEMTSKNRSLITFNLSFLFDKSEMIEEGMMFLIEAFSTGKLAAPKISLYDFSDVAQAHKDIESGKTVGKLVLKM